VSISVFKAFSIIEGELHNEPLPSRSKVRAGDLAAALTSLDAGDAGPAWTMVLTIGTGPGSREMRIPLRAIEAEPYKRSFTQPLPFYELGTSSNAAVADTFSSLWLYRDSIYVTERVPRPSETTEVALRIKVLQFRQDKAIQRLSEQVANFEAAEVHQRAGAKREFISDDVKLLVWTRDGGACVKCGAAKELHFDHVIPLARGGGNDANNLQLLCRSCNLAKGDRLV
jgi:5-methylcytosine-specific restriction endonuclease McrA